MAPVVTIRAAVPSDCELIHALIHELAAYEKESPEIVQATPQTLRETIKFTPPYPGSSNSANCLIAEVAEEAGAEKKPAGFALYFTNYSTWTGKPGIYLEDLFVRPDSRGLGIGKRLLSELALLVKGFNGGRLEWSVLKWNEPSIAFYRKLGANSMDGWVGMRVDGSALDDLAKGGSGLEPSS